MKMDFLCNRQKKTKWDARLRWHDRDSSGKVFPQKQSSCPRRRASHFLSHKDADGYARNLFFPLAIPLLLAACATSTPIFTPVTVDVPVSVPCQPQAPPQPASSLRQLTTQSSLFEKTKALLIELDRRKAYEARLEAVLRSCN